MVPHEGSIDYPNRVNQGPSPGVSPAEVVKDQSRHGDSRKTSKEKETSAATIAATVRLKDAVDYPNRVKQGPSPEVAPTNGVWEQGRHGDSRKTSKNEGDLFPPLLMSWCATKMI